jgi:hypothetical protein
LERIHTSEWVEWLDALCIMGPVHLEPQQALPRPSGSCRFRAADYAPLEDIVELVFEDDEGFLQVIVDSPTAIWVHHEGTGDEQIVFETARGEIRLRHCASRSIAS